MKMPLPLNTQNKFRLTLIVLVLAMFWLAQAHLRPPVPSAPTHWPESLWQAQAQEIGGEPYRENGWRLVNFWATWCPPCIAELPELVELQQRIPELQVVTLAADQTVGRLQQYWRDEQFGLAAFIDLDGRIAAELRVMGYPYSYLIRPDNAIERVYIGRQLWLSDELLTELTLALAGEQSREP